MYVIFVQAKEIAAGLEYLHEQRVIVGDLRAVYSLSHLTAYYLMIL